MFWLLNLFIYFFNIYFFVIIINILGSNLDILYLKSAEYKNGKAKCL